MRFVDNPSEPSFLDRIADMERRIRALEATGGSGLTGTDQTIKGSHDRLDAMLGAGVSSPTGSIVALAPIICAVSNSGAQSIPTGTPTNVTFDTDDDDAEDMHSTVTNTDRVTIPAGRGGWYAMFLAGEFAANATGVRDTRFTVNGATLVRHRHSDGVGAWFAWGTMAELAATNIVRMVVYQTSGGALNLTGQKLIIARLAP